MEDPSREQLERCYAELVEFCFKKVANLEARFIILCHRAQAAGIPCEDINDLKVSAIMEEADIEAVN